MRLLAWNVNHRSNRQRMSSSVAAAITAESPDIVVLTEYVVGQDDEAFRSQLADTGLRFALKSDSPRPNQVLIVSREPIHVIPVAIPEELTWMPSNILRVRVPSAALDVIGFRMPAYEGEEKHLKAEVWNWLLRLAKNEFAERSVIIGDFNTTPGNSDQACGHMFDAFKTHGWRHPLPEGTHSFGRADASYPSRIDHAICSSDVELSDVRWSWSFQSSPELAPIGNTPGIPDHAMLLATAS